MKIYFDKDKNAYGFEIPKPLCIIEEALWKEHAGKDTWDIVDGEFIVIQLNPVVKSIKKALKKLKIVKK